jgi:methionine aminopeptidase
MITIDDGVCHHAPQHKPLPSKDVINVIIGVEIVSAPVPSQFDDRLPTLQSRENLCESKNPRNSFQSFVS